MTISLLILALLAAITVAAAGVVVATRRRIVVVTVEGTSMVPTYRPGDRLLVRRCGPADVGRGQAVVVLRPDLETGWRVAGRSGGRPGDSQWFVKRAAGLPGDPVPTAGGPAALVPPGHLYLLGDNPGSEDSRKWGCCPGDRVVGVVVRALGA
ncbi:MAG: S24/S26 family peptidase [Catenulispora sp.]